MKKNAVKTKRMHRCTAALLVLMLTAALSACSSGSDDTAAETAADTVSAAGDASGDTAEVPEEESADAEVQEETPPEEDEELISADLTIGTPMTSMLFENSTGSDITQVEVRESAEADEDAENEGFSEISMNDSVWESGQVAQIYTEGEIPVEADASGDPLDLVFNVIYDIRVTFEDETTQVLHEVSFTDTDAVMVVCMDADGGFIYLTYETDGEEVSTYDAENEIYQEAAAEAEAEAEAAAAAAAEEEESSSGSGSSGSSGYSYDTGSSGSSSGSQSEDQCVDDLIFN